MLRRCGGYVEEGDIVLLYFGWNDLRPLEIIRGRVLNSALGKFPHESFIGIPYGTFAKGNPKYGNESSRILVLQSVAHLWPRAVPHRTQIIYDADISVILFQLGVRPGSIVAEAGTGSASLTHSLARAVAPNGMVFTFDFHAARVSEAEKELQKSGLGKYVSCHHRDVCATNFELSLFSKAFFDSLVTQNFVKKRRLEEPVSSGTYSDTIHDEADKMNPSHSKISLLHSTNGDLVNQPSNRNQAPTSNIEHSDKDIVIIPEAGYGLPPNSVDMVFLDVPSPWKAIDNVLHILRENGLFCAFSPCIEQVQRTISTLRENSSVFVDIRTVEVLRKIFEPVYHRKSLGYLSKQEVISGKTSLRPQRVSKGHSAYLTFARRSVLLSDTSNDC